MYSSFFLLAVAQLLLLPNWLAGSSGLVAVLILYALRVRKEEQMMLATFGDAYRTYASKTQSVIPWLF
jgi:protein-S-isoprenylcysteine O-methyltransferase Ste14